MASSTARAFIEINTGYILYKLTVLATHVRHAFALGDPCRPRCPAALAGYLQLGRACRFPFACRKRIDLNEHLIGNKEATFLFRVKGDSMVGAGIYEGDTLLVDRSLDPKHLCIVLALLNNEFTVKRFYRRGGVVKLLAENSIYPPRLIKNEDDFTVWGVVTYNLHKLY